MITAARESYGNPLLIINLANLEVNILRNNNKTTLELPITGELRIFRGLVFISNKYNRE